MRRAFAIVAALVLVAALVPGVLAAPAGTPKAADIFAGQTTDIGDVYVWNSATELFVEIDIDGSWCITESHVAVAPAASGIPQANGNPVPGKFSQGDTYAPCEEGGDTFTFSLAEIDTTPVIAVHVKAWDQDSLATATIVSNAGSSNPVAFAETYPTFGAPVAAMVPSYAPGSWPTIAGASYISNQAAGDPFDVNRWRMVTETLAVPGLPLDGDLWVNSDNYERTTLNGTEVQRDDDGGAATVEGTGAEPASASPQTWSTVEHVSFMPKKGDNAFNFLFRNSTWSECCGFVDNPTGLIYKATASYYARSETGWAGTEDFPGSNWATYFEYEVTDVLLETVVVPATLPAGATSTTVLASGESYLLKVSGTVTWTNRNGADLVDAECTSESGGAWAAAAVGYPDALLELQVDSTGVNWTPVAPANGAGCADGHEYTLAVTGTGAAVNLRIYDGTGDVQDPAWFGDNAGSLTVEIWQVVN